MTTAIRLPKSVHDELREAAEDRDLSINFLVIKACEDFLRRLLPPDEIRMTRD